MRGIFNDMQYFSDFIKTYVAGTHLNAIQMSTNNMVFFFVLFFFIKVGCNLKNYIF